MRHEAWCSHASPMGGAAMAAAVRLGVIVPSVNIVVEEWYPTAVPAGVSLHFARMLMPEGSSPERIVEMDRTDGVRAIRQLATCRPHAIAYGCTAVEHRAGPRIRCASAGGDPRHRRLSRHQRDAQHLYRLREARLETGVAISPYTAEVDASEHRLFAE